MNRYELMATTQKSYYGKATVTARKGWAVLTSYTTEVAAIKYEDGKSRLVRYWCGWSKTTANHINDFCRAYGLPTLNKKAWESLPVERFDWVNFYFKG